MASDSCSDLLLLLRSSLLGSLAHPDLQLVEVFTHLHSYFVEAADLHNSPTGLDIVPAADFTHLLLAEVFPALRSALLEPLEDAELLAAAFAQPGAAGCVCAATFAAACAWASEPALQDSVAVVRGAVAELCSGPQPYLPRFQRLMGQLRFQGAGRLLSVGELSATLASLGIPVALDSHSAGSSSRARAVDALELHKHLRTVSAKAYLLSAVHLADWLETLTADIFLRTEQHLLAGVQAKPLPSPAAAAASAAGGSPGSSPQHPALPLVRSPQAAAAAAVAAAAKGSGDSQLPWVDDFSLGFCGPPTLSAALAATPAPSATACSLLLPSPTATASSQPQPSHSLLHCPLHPFRAPLRWQHDRLEVQGITALHTLLQAGAAVESLLLLPSAPAPASARLLRKEGYLPAAAAAAAAPAAASHCLYYRPLAATTGRQGSAGASSALRLVGALRVTERPSARLSTGSRAPSPLAYAASQPLAPSLLPFVFPGSAGELARHCPAPARPEGGLGKLGRWVAAGTWEGLESGGGEGSERHVHSFCLWYWEVPVAAVYFEAEDAGGEGLLLGGRVGGEESVESSISSSEEEVSGEDRGEEGSSFEDDSEEGSSSEEEGRRVPYEQSAGQAAPSRLLKKPSLPALAASAAALEQSGGGGEQLSLDQPIPKQLRKQLLSLMATVLKEAGKKPKAVAPPPLPAAAASTATASATVAAIASTTGAATTPATFTAAAAAATTALAAAPPYGFLLLDLLKLSEPRALLLAALKGTAGSQAGAQPPPQQVLVTASVQCTTSEGTTSSSSSITYKRTVTSRAPGTALLSSSAALLQSGEAVWEPALVSTPGWSGSSSSSSSSAQLSMQQPAFTGVAYKGCCLALPCRAAADAGSSAAATLTVTVSVGGVELGALSLPLTAVMEGRHAMPRYLTLTAPAAATAAAGGLLSGSGGGGGGSSSSGGGNPGGSPPSPKPTSVSASATATSTALASPASPPTGSAPVVNLRAAITWVPCAAPPAAQPSPMAALEALEAQQQQSQRQAAEEQARAVREAEERARGAVKAEAAQLEARSASERRQASEAGAAAAAAARSEEASRTPPLPSPGPPRLSTRASRTLKGTAAAAAAGAAAAARPRRASSAASSSTPTTSLWHPDSLSTTASPFFCRAEGLRNSALAPVLQPPALSKKALACIDRLRASYRAAAAAASSGGSTTAPAFPTLAAAACEADPLRTGLIPASQLLRTLARAGCPCDAATAQEVLSTLLAGSCALLCERWEGEGGASAFATLQASLVDDGERLFVDWVLLADLLEPLPPRPLADAAATLSPSAISAQEEDGELCGLISAAMRHRLRCQCAAAARGADLASCASQRPLTPLEEAHLPLQLLALVTLRDISALCLRAAAASPAAEAAATDRQQQAQGLLQLLSPQHCAVLPVLSLGDALEDEAACLVATADLALVCEVRGLLLGAPPEAAGGGEGSDRHNSTAVCAEVRVQAGAFAEALCQPLAERVVGGSVSFSSSGGSGSSSCSAEAAGESGTPSPLHPPLALQASRFGSLNSLEMHLQAALRSCAHFAGHMDVGAHFAAEGAAAAQAGSAAHPLPAHCVPAHCVRHVLEARLGVCAPAGYAVGEAEEGRYWGALVEAITLRCGLQQQQHRHRQPLVSIPAFLDTYLLLSPAEFQAMAQALEEAADRQAALAARATAAASTGAAAALPLPWAARVSEAFGLAAELSRAAAAAAAGSSQAPHTHLPARAAYSRHLVGALLSLGAPLTHTQALLLCRRYAVSGGVGAGSLPGLGFPVHTEPLLELVGGRGGRFTRAAAASAAQGSSNSSSISSSGSGALVDAHTAAFIHSIAPPGAQVRIVVAAAPSSGSSGGGVQEAAPQAVSSSSSSATATATATATPSAPCGEAWSFPYMPSAAATAAAPSPSTSAAAAAAPPPPPSSASSQRTPSPATQAASTAALAARHTSLGALPPAALPATASHATRLAHFARTGRWACSHCFYESNAPYSQACSMCEGSNALLHGEREREVQVEGEGRVLRAAGGGVKKKAPVPQRAEGVCAVCAWDHKRAVEVCCMCGSGLSGEEPAAASSGSGSAGKGAAVVVAEGAAVVPLPPLSPVRTPVSSGSGRGSGSVVELALSPTVPLTVPYSAHAHMLHSSAQLVDPWRARRGEAGAGVVQRAAAAPALVTALGGAGGGAAAAGPFRPEASAAWGGAGAQSYM